MVSFSGFSGRYSFATCPCAFARLSLFRFWMPLVSFPFVVVLLSLCDSSMVLFVPGPCGLRAARLNPPPPEGSERVWMQIEICLRLSRNQRVKPGPAQSARLAGVSPRGLQIRSKIGLKIDQNFDVILVSFLVPLGSLLASQDDPFWRPKSTQDRPKTRLETTFLRKGRFFKK